MVAPDANRPDGVRTFDGLNASGAWSILPISHDDRVCHDEDPCPRRPASR